MKKLMISVTLILVGLISTGCSSTNDGIQNREKVSSSALENTTSSSDTSKGTSSASISEDKSVTSSKNDVVSSASLSQDNDDDKD